MLSSLYLVRVEVAVYTYEDYIYCDKPGIAMDSEVFELIILVHSHPAVNQGNETPLALVAE